VNVPDTADVKTISPRWIRFRVYLWVGPVLSLALNLRSLTSRPLSHDEFYSLHAITEGLSQHLWEAPWLPYYAVLDAWTLGGSQTSDSWLRALSAIAIASMVLSVSLIAREIAGPRAALMAGILLAIAPATQAFALLARSYGLGAALFTWSTLLFVLALKRREAKWWVGYSGVLLIASVILPFGLVVIVPQAMWAIRQRSVKDLLRPWLLSLVPLVPLVVIGLWAMQEYSSARAWAPRASLSNLPFGLEWVASAGSVPITAGGMGGMALVLLAALSPQGRAWLWGVLAAGALLWLASLGPTSFWVGQSFLPLVPLVALGAGLTLAELPTKVAAGVLVLVAISTVPAYTWLRLPWNAEPDMVTAVNIMREEWQPEDQIFDDGQIFGLHPAAVHYLGAEYTNVATEQPQGRYWTVYGGLPCEALQAWPLDGGVALTLCSGTPEHGASE
jgi:Dolichyl-phosphate-mannose-protein mannosyltransferase